MRAFEGQSTASVELRAVQESDLEAFFEHQSDPVSCAVAAFPSREREAFMRHWAKVLADSTGLVRTVVVEGRVVGNVVSFGPREERLVGYWIGREFWGRGFATRALAAFVALEKTRPLFAAVATSNVASIRVLAKCGFVVDRGPARAPDGVEELVLRLDAAS
ncbi:MAG: GNAT family N-acetyltransferase [Planctomycetes bacterium]|nr:GNAT family N-acetyltransferase [Planctomycetota bacterium]